MQLDIDVTVKKNLIKGLYVEILTSNEDTERGYIKEILSQSNNKKGIRVKLTNGIEGRVQYVFSKHEIKAENFKFYNLFFFQPNIYSLWNKKMRTYVTINRLNQIYKNYEQTAFLFTTKEKAKGLIAGTELDNPDIQIKSISRKKPIVESFNHIQVDKFSIDGERKLSFEKMKEWEKYIRQQ
ncbi:DUF2196 domain-containing protein [Bacillus sp. NPDC094106]|uniref:DUF2196 domain-containing protein n=1 Tax=Bacillus sp. NPDC094106 TaxID=3363949 RepID=UPI003815323E